MAKELCTTNQLLYRTGETGLLPTEAESNPEQIRYVCNGILIARLIQNVTPELSVLTKKRSSSSRIYNPNKSDFHSQLKEDDLDIYEIIQNAADREAESASSTSAPSVVRAAYNFLLNQESGKKNPQNIKKKDPVAFLLASGAGTQTLATYTMLDGIPNLYQTARQTGDPSYAQSLTFDRYMAIADKSFSTFLNRIAGVSIKDIGPDGLIDALFDINFEYNFSKLRTDAVELRNSAVCIKDSVWKQHVKNPARGCPSKISSRVLEPFLDRPASYPNAMRGMHDAYMGVIAA